MPNLLTRLFRRSPDEITRFSLSDYLRAIADGRFGMTGLGSPAVSYAQGRPAEKVENSFSGYVYGGYKANPIVFGVMTKRASVFSEARFMWRRFEDGRPGDLFSDSALKVLNRPWPNGTTGELLVRMIQDVDLAGNCYLVNEGDRLRRLRPDWVQIVLSGDPRTDLDVDVIGYSYTPGSPDAGDGRVYLPDEVMHWSPIPDPDALYRGMSWLTPVVREIQGDSAAVDHKLAFFANGATLGPIVKVPAGLTVTQFKDFITASNEAHQGVQNAYRPMYVGGGADVTLGQATMQQMDFKSLQGGFETRVCVAGQVPAVIVGVSEGLAGSSLNAGNYNAAKRSFVDGTLRPLWRSACAALATIVDVPADAELWWDERDIAYLREDMQDLAAIQQTQASTINTLITAGFEPDTTVPAVVTNDFTTLKHSGMTSVQLQPPGTTANGAAATDGAPAVDPAATAGVDYAAALESFRSDLAETFDEIERKFNPDQVRDPHSGEWTDVPGSGLLSFEYIQELYGQQIDEVEWQADSFVGVHERDGIILYFDTKPGSQDDHARFDVILDGLDGDAARALADQVEGIVSGAEQDDGGTPVSPNGLVDWSIVGRMLVGYDQAGDISLRVVGDDEDRAPSSTREQMHGLDGLDTSQEDATALVEALRELAPLADETEAARAHFMRRYATTLEVFRAEILDEDSLQRAADYYDVRNPKGSVGGGRFRSLADRVTVALNGFLNGDGANDPLEPFTRDQLRKASKDLGMPPRRGASAEEIKLGLLTDARKRFRAEKDNPTPKPDAKFTLKGGAHRNKDVGVYQEADGKVSLYEESGSGARGARVVTVDDLAGLEKWANDNGEAELADWARSEGGTPPVPAPAKTATKRAPRKATPSADLTGADGLSDNPAVRNVQIENRVRLAYSETANDAGWTQMTRLRRNRNLKDVSREEVDAAMGRLIEEPDVFMHHELNQKVLTPADRAAAVNIGGEPRHNVRIGDPSLRPLPAPATKRAPRKAVPKGDLTGANGLSSDPAVRDVQVENRIREAYRAAYKDAHGATPDMYVGLAAIREHLGESMSRKDVDAALMRMAVESGGRRDGSVNIVPVENSRALTQAERDSALRMGGENHHAIAMDDPSPRPLPTTDQPSAPAKAAPKAATPKRLRDVVTGDVVIWEPPGEAPMLGRVTREPGKGVKVDWSGGRREHITTARLPKETDVRVATPEEIDRLGPIQPTIDGPAAPRKAVPKAATEPSALSDYDQAKADMEAAQADVERFTNVDPSKLTPDERSKFYDDLFAAQDRSRAAGDRFRQLEQQRKAAEPPPPAFVPNNPKVDRDIRDAVASLTGRTDLPSGGMFVGNPDWGIPMTDMHEMNRTNGNVYLADVRDALGEKYSRKEVDAALMDMVRDPSIRLTPIAASTSLSQRDRDSALHMGGTSYDLIKFETPDALPAWDLPAKTDEARLQANQERQAVVDKARIAGHIAADLAELDYNSGNPDVMAERLGTLAQKARDDVSQGAPLPDGLDKLEQAAATGDAAKMRRAVATFARANGITVVGKPGGRDKFDPSVHEAQGSRPAVGAAVEIIRPGVSTSHNGEDIQVTKPLVVDVSPDPTPAKAVKKAAPAAKSPTASTPDATLATLRDMPTETRRDALDLRKMDDLKAMLRESGLPVSGRKRDLVDRLVGHLDGGSTAPAKTASAKDRRVATMATRLHEDWRKTRLQGDGSFEPRVKATKDEAWIAAHGTDQVDIANTNYADLPEDWKAENRAAAEVIDNILQRDGGKVDLSDKQVRDQVGEEIHQEWLKRNDWAKGGELDVPFVDLPKSEQDKDIDQLRVAMGGDAPGAVKKAAPPAAPGQGLQPGYQLHVLPALHAPGRYNVKAVYPDGSEAHVIQNLSPTQARRELERLKAAGPDVVDAEYAKNSRASRERNQRLMDAEALKERRTLRRRQLQGGGLVRLREQLATRGLDTSGTTAQLINRLLDAEGLDAPSKAAVPKADGGQGSSILTQEDLQEGLTDSVQHDLASVQIHVRAASRVAERWDVAPADLEALAREDGTWDFYSGLPADEQKKRFLQSQFAQWDSGSGKPVSVMAIQAAARESGVTVDLNEREQRIYDWIQAHPGAGHAAESMGRAMYAATQEWFRERGITSVKAQRATFTPGTEDANLYTSWSAMDAGNYLQQTSQHSVVEADIPVAQIFSVPGTGYGSPAEAEFVVIGGVPSTTIYMPDVAN